MIGEIKCNNCPLEEMCSFTYDVKYELEWSKCPLYRIVLEAESNE